MTDRISTLFKGIAAYEQHPYRRVCDTPKAVWEEGGSSLFDYSVYGNPSSKMDAVFCVPSLINKSYILDLSEEWSFMRYLAGCGFTPYLLDWGMPGGSEKGFTLEDFIARLIRALEHVVALQGGKPIALTGYCMGGILALAVAQLRPDLVSRIALLATPWDFHVPSYRRIAVDDKTLATLGGILESVPTCAPEWVQLLFYYTQPFSIHEKYIQFAALDDQGSEEITLQVAIEQWANDGMPLTSAVARSCIIDWVHHNTLARGKWKVGRVTIDPGRVTVPSFVVMPAYDRIVPKESSVPLVDALPLVDTLTPKTGHVRMVAGRAAKQELWQPLAIWLRS